MKSSKWELPPSEEARIANIEDNEIKIIYLAYLLDTYHQQSKLQISILNNAIDILENENFDANTMNSLYMLLSNGAIKIDQKEISEKLHATAQIFQGQDNA